MRAPTIALLLLTVAPVCAVELEVIDAGDHHQIVVQNETLRMIVVPEWGGRITSLVDRGLEADVVWSEGIEGGALDDRDDFTAAAYEYQTELRHDDTEAVVSLTGTALGGFQIRKTLVVADGKSLIEERLTVANGSQRPRRFWQRNFFRPGGEALTGDETYFLPTADGVVADPGMRGRHEDFSAGWCGVIDGATGHGIMAIADVAFLEQFYFWRGSGETPTLEWICSEVAPGQKVTSRIWIALTSDVSEYSDEVAARFVGPAWWREGALQIAELPNWVDLRPKVEPDEEQMARGFTLYRTWGEDPGAELSELRFDCPTEGSDSLTLQVAAFADVEATAALTGEGAGAFELLRMDDDRHRLLPARSLALAPDDVRQLQVVFHPVEAREPGEVSAELVLTGLGGRTQTVALEGHVWPVRLPDRRLVWLKGYGGSTYMFTGGPDLTPEKLEQLEFYLNDGEELGNSVCEITLNMNQTFDRVLLRGTDITLGEAMENRRELLADLDDLPALDFSYFNPWVHQAQLRGFRRAETGAPSFGRYTTTALIYGVLGGEVPPESEEFRKVYVWYLSELGRWLVERGFPEVFVKVSDEISPDEVPDWIARAEVCRQAGMRPYTTITGQVAATPTLLNRMNSVAEAWQIQWLSTQVFRDLTTKRYVTATRKADIGGGPWSGYGNGGAQDTYATQPFEALGVQPAHLSAWRVLVDGEELETIGSPWGNKRTGVAALLSPTLYVSLPDGGDPAEGEHAIEFMYTIREPDPNGEVLVAIEDSDVVSFYTGSGKTWQVSYERARGFALFPAVRGYPGWGWWAYAHGWHADSRIVWPEEGEAVRTPCWWGLRDGNQDCDLHVLARAMIGRAREDADTGAQRAALAAATAALDGLVGPEEDALITLEPRDYRGRLYYDYPQDGVEADLRETRRRVLQVIADLRTAFPDVDFAPDLYWGDTLVLAHNEGWSSLLQAEDPDPAHSAIVRDGIAAARELFGERPEQQAMPPAEARFGIVIFEALPAPEALAEYGLNAEELELSESYPGAGDYMILPGRTADRPCAVIIGGDEEGATLGLRCFVKLLEPRW